MKTKSLAYYSAIVAAICVLCTGHAWGFTEGTPNNFFGTGAGGSITTGVDDSFFGADAGNANTSGGANSFFGAFSGSANTSGAADAFFGAYAGNANITGVANTFIGVTAGYSTTIGNYNTFIGNSAGYLNLIGSGNVFLGYEAGFGESGSNKLYIDNCAVGVLCSSPLIYGEFDNRIVNIDGAVGVSAHAVSKSQLHLSLNGADVGGWLTSVGANQLFMSSGAAYDAVAGGWIQKASAGKAVVAGSDSSGYRVLTSMAGAVGSAITPVLRFHVNYNGRVGINKAAVNTRAIDTSTGAYLSTGGVWTNASSRELKDNIREISAEEAISAVKELNPVTFTYKADEGEKHAGFIAEDVPELVATKDRKGLSAMDIVAVLTKVVQDQRTAIDNLTEKLARLEMELNRLKNRDITARVIERE